MRVCRLAVASAHDGGQHSPPRTLVSPRTCHRLRILLILAFAATIFSRRSPDFHSSLRLGSFFLPKSGLIVLSHLSRSRTILCIVRQACAREAGPHVLVEFLQVGVEVMLVEECLVVVVERLEEVDILFVFDECCQEIRFLRCDLRSRVVNERSRICSR